MAFQRDVSVIQDRFESILTHAVTEVKTKEDPLVLNDYKKLFKKKVPLSLRSYVAAYIVKQLASGMSVAHGAAKASFGERNRSARFEKKVKEVSGGKGGENGRMPKSTKATKKEVLSSVRIVIDPDSAVTIFVSVGRNRGVHPRDLIALICQRVPLDRERVGEIRVLDNYSFVQVYADDAEKIIGALNGTEYRSRKLTVSRSRKKEDETDCAPESINASAGTSEPTCSELRNKEAAESVEPFSAQNTDEL